MSESSLRLELQRDLLWRLDARDACVADHRVGGRMVVPLAYVVAFAVELLAAAAGVSWVTLRDFIARRRLVVDGDETVRVVAVPRPEDLFLRFTAGGAVHCTVRVPHAASPRPDEFLGALASQTSGAEIGGDDLYERYRELGLDYGPHLRRIRALVVEGDVARARIDGTGLPEGASGMAAVIDAAFQSLLGHAFAVAAREGALYLPVSFEEGRFASELPRSAEYLALSRPRATRSVVGAMRMFDASVVTREGKPALHIRALAIMKAGTSPG